MIIIYKNDGSIFSKSDSDYIQQGSNDVNKIFVGFVDNAHTTFSCVARFIRANDTETTQMGVTAPFTYNGYNYLGWVFNLTSEETKYAGNLRVFISFYDAFGGIQNTYITNLIINATGYPATGEPTAPITTAEFNSFMAQIAAKQPLQGMTSVVVEQLPASGVVGVLYFLKGAITGKIYSQYIWNGSAFVWVGSLVLDAFATLEEQRAFEEELREEWQAYYLDLNNQWNTYKQQVDNKVNNALDMTPIPVATVSDLPPQGATQPYVVAEDGYWYYWNGSAWIQGQQYQAVTGYKTLPLGILNKAYVNEIIDNVGSLCYIEIEGIGEDIVNELTGNFPYGEGYAWYDVESNKVMFWFYNGLYEIQIIGTTYTLSNTLKAARVDFDNSSSGLDARNVQGALDFLSTTNLLAKKDLLEYSGTSTYVNNPTGIDIPVSRLGKRFVKLIIKGTVETSNGQLYFGGAWYSYPNKRGHVSNLVNSPYVSITSGTTVIYKDFEIPNNAEYLNISPYLYGTDGVEKTASIRDIVIIDDDQSDEKIILNKKIALPDKSVNVNQTDFINKTVIYDGAVDLTSIAVGSYKIIATAEVKDTDIISCMLEDERTLGFNIAAVCYTADGQFLGDATRYQRNQAGYWVLLPNTGKIEVLASKVAERQNVKRVLVYKNSYGNELLENIQPVDNYFRTIHLPKLYIKGCIGSMSKDVEVEDLEYEYGALTGTCSMKWQGSSSLNYPKKNFTIKFDNKFEAKEGWGSQKKYCLKANWVDVTQSKNIVNARAWGSIVKARNDLDNVGLTKLKNSPNGGAIDGFPIVLFINEMCFGLYTFNIPKDKWMMGMGEGTQEALIGAESYDFGHANPSFGDGEDLEIEYATDENNIGWITNDINSIYTAIQNNDLNALANIVDIQSCLDYWLFSNVICNTDAQARNWLLGKYDNSKWFITGYDMDLTHGSYFERYVPLNSPRGNMDNYLFNKVVKLLGKEAVIQRFNELTHPVNGLLGINKLWERFNEFGKSIPRQAIDKDLEIWNSLHARSSQDTIERAFTTHKTRLELMPQWIDEFFE